MSLARQEFWRLSRIAIAFYSAGVTDGSYEALMDKIAAEVSEEQWEELTSWLDEIDLALGETDRATLIQREKVVARREGRKSRYPTLFSLYGGDREALEMLAALVKEHGIAPPTY